MASKITHKIQTSLRDVLKVSFPPSMNGLLQEASKPYPDFENIASLIRTDPGLATTVISLVNSAAYSLKERVSDLKRAAVILGSNEILKLAISATFVRNIQKKTGKKLGFINWRKIVWAAGAAELIARQICPQKSRQVYLAALLKDLSLMLICLFDNETLEEARKVVCPEEKGEDFIQADNGQLEREMAAWGMDHTELTRKILEGWNFPRESCGYMAGHHDLQAVDEASPGMQAVIIGAYWAELELSQQKDINGVLQLRSIMGRLPGLAELDFEELRKEIAANFKAICSNLGISEESEVERLYDCSLAKIQDFYFMAQGVEQINDSLDIVLQQIAQHLFWLWGIQEFRAALRSPITGHYHLYNFQGKEDLQVVRETSESRELRTEGKSGETEIEVLTASGNYGFFWIKDEVLPDGDCRALFLYFRLLSRSYEVYYLHRRDMSGKAQMMDLLPVGVARMDKQGLVVQANPKFCRFAGRQSVPEGEYFAHILPIKEELLQDREWGIFMSGNSERYSRLFCPLTPEGGEYTCWHIAAHRITLEGSEQVMALMEDISGITTLEEDVLRQREFMQAMLESMQDIVLTVDNQGNILYASPRLGKDLIGKNIFRVATPSGFVPFKWGPEILEDNSSPVEVTFDSGKDIWSLELLITRLSGGDPRYLVVARDLTTIRRLEQKVKRQAVFDGLTNIYNRRQLEIFLNREVPRAKRTGGELGMIFVDMDRFKDFNDRFGHQGGDKALILLADILRSQSRSGTDFPCRYGGDEFILLASETSESGLEQLATRIRDKFYGHYPREMSLSIGMAFLREGESGEDLLKRADMAAYTAKENGGNMLIWG